MSRKRERACAAMPIPATLSAQLKDYLWTRDQIGQSGADIYRLHGKPGAPDLFLKHGTDAIAATITDEANRLRWLAQYLPVPQLMQFVRTGNQAWLLMTALKGKTAYQLLASHPELGPAVVDALAAFLRRLHAIPLNACPYSSDHVARLALARQRIAADLIDTDDFDDERQGWTAEQVWLALQQHLPFTPDHIITHGDFSLDNLLMHDGEITGCIDVARLGIADRYQDLAILHNCLGEFGRPLQQRLFQQYGLPEPDQDKLQFHLLLDELF
ncbi:APH(3')-I family aminoglycoside O-phosphotransferase [Janthinobacterium sp. Mn2066]|uniref:APH(3')-I family aminoglycoside O-phosphotransferase n=1 Tax=Janthinobacterium sp. Mn2066 TaxID=3395264 RepID=UPI003BD47F65